MKGVPIMKAKRWTLGVVLAAAVSLWGLIEADASPFSSYVLTDDLSNKVNGVAPQASNWENEPGADDPDDSGSSSGGSSDSSGDGNNGHGNNVDGVDSSNKGNGGNKVDESCPEGGECVDDEIVKTNNGGSKK